MLKTLIQKELLQQLHSRKFIISAVISICLMLLCLQISTESYLNKLAEYQNVQNAYKKAIQEVQNLTVETAFSYRSDFDPNIFRKPTPLCIFSQGKENDLGGMVAVGSRVPFIAQPIGKTDFFNEFDMAEVLDDAFAKIDFVLAIQFLFSLIAIFVAFDLVTGERETGMLKLVQAQNVSRLKVIAGKWLAGSIVLGCTMLLGLLLGMIYLLLIKGIVFDNIHVVRLILIFTLAVIYVLFFFQFALLSSCILRSSQMTIMVMLFIWTLAIFIMPNFSLLIGKTISPLPPIDDLSMRTRKIAKEADIKKWQTKSSEERDRIRKQEYRDIWQIQKYHLDQMKQQRQTSMLISLISPAPTFAFATEYLAGTSVADYEVFMERARLESANWFKQQFPKDMTPEKLLSLRRQYLQTFSQATFDTNRTGLDDALRNAAPFIVWLIILNSVLYFSIVVYYDRRTKIL